MEFVTDRHTQPKMGLMVKTGADKLRTFVLPFSSRTLLSSFLPTTAHTLKERRYKTTILLVLYACETCLSVTNKKGDKSTVSVTKNC